MSEIHMSDSEIKEMFGGEAQPGKINAQEMEVGLALQSIRAQLLNLTERAKVGTVQLAGRLGISPSAVSRFLGGEGDMKVSTAVLYGRALGHRWDCALVPDEACEARGNHHGRIEVSLGIASLGTMTSGATQVVNVVDPVADWWISQKPRVQVIG